MNVACVLLIKVTLKGLKGIEDVEFQTTRTLTFPPVEGLTLVFANEQNDDEYEMVLGAPRYEFAESAFVEYQEDESWLEKIRDGVTKEQALRDLIDYYKGFGFKYINHEKRVIKAVGA